MIKREKSVVCSVLLLLVAIECIISNLWMTQEQRKLIDWSSNSALSVASKNAAIIWVASGVLGVIMFILLAVYFTNIRRRSLLSAFYIIYIIQTVFSIIRVFFVNLKATGNLFDSGFDAYTLRIIAFSVLPSLLLIIVLLFLLVDSLKKQEKLSTTRAAFIIYIIMTVIGQLSALYSIYTLLMGHSYSTGAMNAVMLSVVSTLIGKVNAYTRLGCLCWLYFGMFTSDPNKQLIEAEE